MICKSAKNSGSAKNRGYANQNNRFNLVYLTLWFDDDAGHAVGTTDRGEEMSVLAELRRAFLALPAEVDIPGTSDTWRALAAFPAEATAHATAGLATPALARAAPLPAFELLVNLPFLSRSWRLMRSDCAGSFIPALPITRRRRRSLEVGGCGGGEQCGEGTRSGGGGS